MYSRPINYSNFEKAIVGDYQVSYMTDKDQTLNYEMFDTLEQAKKKADELIAKKYHIIIFKKKVVKDGSYSWDIIPYGNYDNRYYDRYIILTLCVIILILAFKILRK